MPPPVGKVEVRKGPGKTTELYLQAPHISAKEELGQVGDRTHNVNRRLQQPSGNGKSRNELRRKRYRKSALTGRRNGGLEEGVRREDRQERVQAQKGLQQRRHRHMQERLPDNPPGNGLGGQTGGHTSPSRRIPFQSKKQPLLQDDPAHDLMQNNKNPSSPRRPSLKRDSSTEAKTLQRRSENIVSVRDFPDQHHLRTPSNFLPSNVQFQSKRDDSAPQKLGNSSALAITNSGLRQHFNQLPILETAVTLKSQKIQRRTNEDGSRSLTFERLTSGSSYEEELQAYKFDHSQVQFGQPITIIPSRDKWNVEPKDTPCE